MRAIALLLVGLVFGKQFTHAPTALAQSAPTSDVTLRVATFGGQSGEVEKSYVGDRFTNMPSSEEDLKQLSSPNWKLYNQNLKAAMDYWNRNVKH